MAILAENGGSCLWSSDEYNLMVDHVYGLPQGCTSSGVYADNQHQEQFYLDLKPKSAGGIDIGVYSDNRCSMEYSGGISTQKIWRKYVSNQAEAANNYNNGADNNYEDGAANDEDGDDDNSIQYSQTIEYKKIQSVNKALQAFQVCQPCLNCNSVNQCSMFAQNGISKASFQDIATARQQGAIQQTYIGGESWWTRNGFLLLSILVLLVGVTIFYFVFRKVNKRIGVDSKPLIADNR